MPRYEFSELEAAIYETPEDPDAWAVYGDWLQSLDDPRGEAVAIWVANEKKEIKKGHISRYNDILEANREAWLSEDLISALFTEARGFPLVTLDWKYGFLFRARVSCNHNYDSSAADTAKIIKDILLSPSSRFLQELIIGVPEGLEDGAADFSDCIDVIIQAGIRPSIRRLHLGDFDSGECDMSSSHLDRLDPLLPLLPNLEWLLAHGGGIFFKDLQHSKLKDLTLETGGMPVGTIQALSRGSMPALENLTIWLGEESWGADAGIDDFEGFFNSYNFPALKHLGLQNSDFQNDIAAGIVNAPILAQLKSLDLSMGTMTDEGAQALLDGAEALIHLERINVEDNFISDALAGKLEAVFKDKINVSGQGSYDGDDGRLYVSVGE